MSEESFADKKTESVYGRDKVVRIINSVIEKVGEAGDFSKESLFRELHELKAVIDEARTEIANIQPLDINDKHLPSATDELDAIVAATEEATSTIMDACEGLEDIAAKVGGDVSDAITNHVTGIYEACSFQDITGQRISKVVNSLKVVESKVEKILHVVSEKGQVHLPEEEEKGPKELTDADLMNGPQMPDKSISQDEIDRLLAEFD